MKRFFARVYCAANAVLPRTIARVLSAEDRFGSEVVVREWLHSKAGRSGCRGCAKPRLQATVYRLPMHEYQCILPSLIFIFLFFYNGLRYSKIEHGVLGVECSNHSVPTILFNDLAQLSRVGLFHVRDFCVTSPNFTPASSSESSAPAHASEWLTPYLQLLSDAPAKRRSSDW